MKILYLSQRFPYPPDRGDRIAVYNHIKHLSRTHEIYAASLADPRTDLPKVREFRANGVKPLVVPHSIASSWLGMAYAFGLRQPLTLGFYRNSRLMDSIELLIKSWRPDVAIAFSSSMAQYLESHDHISRIINFCDMDSQKWADLAKHSWGMKRAVFRREAKLLLEYERRIAAQFSASCVVTQREAELFNQLIPNQPINVIENGVDAEYFQAIARNANPAELTFIGVMDYPPNVEAVIYFAKNVWPLIRSELPQTNFTIVGSRPSREILRLRKMPGISVTGFVPDVRPYLARTSLVVVPLAVARGIQNKVLEAMAAGAPVLATPAAAAGLTCESRELISIVNRDPQSFAMAAIRMVKDQKSSENKARNAQKFVAQNYSWENKGRDLEALLHNVVRAKAA
jgi:sugar transferase (PEP-CTERM/EpsH1 system associated)